MLFVYARALSGEWSSGGGGAAIIALPASPSLKVGDAPGRYNSKLVVIVTR